MSKKTTVVALFLLITLVVIVSLPANAAVTATSVEVRGSVANANALKAANTGVTWNSATFAGFWYDLKDNKSTESLTVVSFSGERTIDKYNLIYTTGKQAIQFKVSSEKNRTVEYGLDSTGNNPLSTGDHYYDVVGWMAEKYVGINGKNNKLAKLIFEQNISDNKTLAVGETWEMGGGYTLTAQAIDASSNPRLVWFVLSKDGTKLDDKVIEAAAADGTGTQGVYTFNENVGGESNVPIFVTYIDSVFSGATSDMVQLKYTWLIVNSITEVKAGDMYGIFKVDTENPLKLKSDSAVSLSKDSVITLSGNLKFRVSDSDSSDVRFYPMIVRNTPGTWEIRGSVANANALKAANTGVTWNSTSFAGFWYALKTDQSTETLTVQAFNDVRSIDQYKLWYNTTKAPTMFMVSFEKNRTVEYGLDSTGNNPLSTGDHYYDVVGWIGEKYVGINGKNNKLAKLIFEQDISDNKTLTVGETWEMGGGYTLTAQAIDASSNPRLVWFVLSKDGTKLDDKVIEAAAPDGGGGTQGVYTFNENVGGESNVPIFVTYIDSVFSGATSDMVQLKYTWLIDNSITELKVGDMYGIFKVDSENPLTLKSNSSVFLYKDRTVTLAGNMKFRISDSEDVRFFPKIDYIIGDGGFPTTDPVHNINKGTNYTTIQAAINDSSPGDEIHVDSRTYYENVNVNKQLTLLGIGMPVVDARGSGSAITLAADGIILEGFTATGGRYYFSEAGIKVISNSNTLRGNNANSNNVHGIFLSSSSNNILKGNNASNNVHGIGLSSSSNNNTLSDNNANSNNDTGIYLFSSNNTLSGNNANSNNVRGIYLSSSSNNMLSGNNANSNNYFGIELFHSSNNTLNRNNANSNNYPSIWMYGSSNNNTLIGNNANSNNYEGIGLSSSSNNKIYHNNLYRGYDDTNNNSWHSGYPSGGNNWSDYTGVDLNSGPSQNITGSDGIGDTPYNIGGGGGAQDRYPLMAPYTGEPTPPSIAVGQGAPDLATKNHFIDAYNRNGGIIFLGNPATEVHRAWGFLVQDFPGASGYGGGIIIYNPYKNYAYYIHSEIWEQYYSLGGPNAKTNLNFWLGPPTSDIEPYVHLLPPENSKYGTPFRYQKFEGGALELNITSGKVFEVHGGILQKWRELGYAASNLGLPTTDEREAAVSPVSGFTGRYSVFEGGIIHWIRERNEIFVIGLNQPEGKKIADKYYAEGGSGGGLGFPVSDDYLNNFGYLQVNFEGGYITTTDGINYVAYPKDVTSGPTITIEIPQTDFHTDERRIRLSGIADSDGLITRIDAKVQAGNGNPTFYRIGYNYQTKTWETNVGLQYGLNIIDVSIADGNFHASRDTIYVYYDIPDFSFAHIADVHIGDGTLPISSIKKSRITNVLNQINNELPKPDFILISGDLVDYNNEDYFNQFNDIFKDVKAYIVAGNHDRRTIWPGIGGDDNLNNYRKNVDKSQNLHYIDEIYNFEEKGYQFIGLDSGSDYDYFYLDPKYYYMHDFSPEGTGLTYPQLSGLMEFEKTTPKIIFMHNPAIDNSDDEKPIQCYLYPLTPEICKPSLIPNINYGGNDETIANNRENFIDYTTEYNVQLVLSGHTHENYIFNSHGTKLDVLSEDRPLFIQTGSAMGNEYKDESDGLSFSNRPPLYGYRIIDLRDGKAYPRQFRPMEPLLAPNTDLMPQFESTDRSKLTLELRCPANLHVYDSQGRHTGLNSSGGIETNIPESFYIGRYNASDPDEPETIFIYNATEEYSFEIIANLTEEQKNSPENESFNFTIDRQSEGIQTIESFQNITLNENTTATLQVNITTENPKMSLDYNGDTITDETKYPNYIETNYAPTAAIITPEIGSIYNQTEIVEFNGTGRDPEDGILTNRSLVWYSDIDGFIGSGERFSTVNLSAGSHIITLIVNDIMYLYGASSMTITIADTAPPVTTLIPSGTLGNNGWFISDVNVTLTATDTQTGSGVNITEYSFDNATWTTYFTRFNITSEGITTVYYRSIDKIGNVESIKNQTIQIDKKLPASIINPQTITGSTWLNFTWLNPPTPDFSHVMLYLNGSFITNITAPQNYYNFTGLVQETSYELGTHTVDSSGNVNQTWVNATGRTALSVLIPIQITNPDANPAIILNDNGRARPPGTNITRLNVTVIGNVASVYIDLSPLGGSATVPMAKISGTDIYTTTTNATSGINLTNYLVVNATGTSGNFNNSVRIPVTVLLRGDIVRDNKIDLKDLLYMRRHLAGLEPSINPLVADIQPAEGDGKVDLKDLLFLRRYLAGLEPVI